MLQQIQPYLMFNGQCEAAMAFYRDALGAEQMMLMRYRDSPEPMPPEHAPPPGSDDKVMHGALQVGATTLMLCDDMTPGAPKMQGFSLSIGYPDPAALDRAFAALSAGGQVTMAPGPTFWSPCFGMLTDRYGVGWMLSVQAPPAG